MNSTQPIPASNRRCRHCAAPIPADSPGALCPRCLLGAALDPAEPIACPSTPPETVPEARFQGSPPFRSFGDYELIEELGRGGMGTVWRARHLRLDREVALKFVLQGAFASESERQRFQDEARAAAALDHPGIVPLYEVGEFEGHPFFSMRLVSGGNLSARPRTEELNPATCADLVSRIARAVHHAHQRGILHRDLKPANILIEDGQPVVADFGLAKRLGASAGMTATGTILGSPAYMAPEQAAGHSHAISTASDVYSLGAILYDLLTGSPPFVADTPLATLRLVTDTDPSRPRDRNRRIDRDLETICLKCLAKDPRERYGSADALADDLQRWIHRETISARPSPFWERAWRWTRRHPTFAVAGFAVLVTAMAGVAAFLGQFRQTQAALRQAEATALAERSARAVIIHADRVWPYSSEVRVAAPSPDGSRLLVTEGAKAHLIDLRSGLPVMTFAGHTSSVRVARWSGDGHRVLTASTCQEQPVWDDPLGAYGDQTVHVWAADTGSLVGRLDNPFSDVLMQAAISPDGRSVALGSVHGEAAWWQPDAAETAKVWPAFDVQIRSIEFDPQGSHVLMTPGDRVTWIRRPMPNGGTFGHIGLHAESIGRLFSLGRTQEVFHLEPASQRRVPHWSLTNANLRPMESTRSVAAFSSDGRWVLTGGWHPANTALWDASDGSLRHRLSGPTQAVHCVAMSRDGSRAAAGGVDRAARVWDTRSGGLKGVLGPHPRNVTRIEFAPDPRWLLTVCADQKIRVWDIEEGVCVALLRGHTGEVHDAHFLPDGEQIVSASSDRTARLWRWATFEQMSQRLDGHSSRIRSLRFDAQGHRVVGGAADGTARVWNVDRREPTHRLDPSPGRGLDDGLVRANGGSHLRDAAFSPDGLHIVTARSDPQVSRSFNPFPNLLPRVLAPPAHPLPWLPGRIWDARTGQIEASIAATNLAFAGVEFSPDGRRVLFRSDDFPRRVSRVGLWKWKQYSYSHGYGGPAYGQAELYDFTTQRRLAVLGGHGGELRAAMFSPDGTGILTADRTGVVLWRGNGERHVELPEAQGRDWTTFSPDGSKVLSQDASGIPTLFDTETGRPLLRYPEAGSEVWEAWFALGGSEVGAIDAQGNLVTWETVSGRVLWKARGSGGNTGVTVVSPNSRWMASVVGEQTLDLWDLKLRRLVRSIERHVHPISALAFSAGDTWLASGDDSGEVWIWPLRLVERAGPETPSDTSHPSG